MILYLELASAALLFASAGFWLAAGRVKPPVLHGVIGEIGEPLRKVSLALTRQSDLNRTGAVFAALGVALQAVAAVFGAAT